MDKLAAIKYRIKIECYIDEQDTGYMGENVGFAEFYKWAQEQASYYQVYIQQGGTEPKLVRSTITVESIVLVPKKE